MQLEPLENIDFLGLSHYSPPPHKNIPPHYGIITMIGEGAIGYLTTKVGGYNGKTRFSF